MKPPAAPTRTMNPPLILPESATDDDVRRVLPVGGYAFKFDRDAHGQLGICLLVGKPGGPWRSGIYETGTELRLRLFASDMARRHPAAEWVRQG